MERYANLKYIESIIGYVIVGVCFLTMLVVGLCLYYSQHDTPMQKIKKWIKEKKGKQNENQ